MSTYHPSQFDTPPEQVTQWAARAAAADHARHIKKGHDLNPYCTEGARTDWQRGFYNAGPRSYDHPTRYADFCTQYNRGRAAALIVQANEELDA
jgi:hypothetical protein